MLLTIHQSPFKKWAGIYFQSCFYLAFLIHYKTMPMSGLMFFMSISMLKDKLGLTLLVSLSILPISALIIYNGVDFSYQAFLLNKQSGDLDGLPYRFIIKGVIPLSVILLVISGFIFTHNNLKKLKP